MDTSAVGTPPRLRCTASASVPVLRPIASTVKAIFSFSAVSYRSSERRGLSVEPLLSTGPEPSSCLPDSFTSMPGASVAWVTSTTIAASGCSEKALVREPPNVVSSCAAATATNSQRARLQRHERAEPVVEGARGDAPVGQLERITIDHRYVADPHHRAC